MTKKSIGNLLLFGLIVAAFLGLYAMSGQDLEVMLSSIWRFVAAVGTFIATIVASLLSVVGTFFS